MDTTLAFIDGQLVDATETYDNIDPATGQPIGATALSSADDVDRAVQAARGAQPGWAATKPEDRADVLEKIADLIVANHEELARLESADTGKPLTQARTDATVAARYFRFYGRAIDSYYGLHIPVGDDLHVYTRREPLGVCANILAWNYPMQLLSRAAATALATGNASVIKPGDETPRTAVRIAQLAVEAGLPAGVFNVVPGTGAVTGAALSHHEDVDHLGFVGSTQIGQEIAAAGAKRVVPVILELGGKSPHVVFPDADLDEAATYITKGILANAGQTCSAGSRLVVHESVADELTDRLRAAFAKVTIGPGLEDKDLGPLVSTKQQVRVRGFVEEAEGEVVAGGGVPQGMESGAYFEPTLIVGVDPQSRIAQEEVFGPVLATMTFADEDEAVAIANATDYGLMAAVWTKDLSRAHRVAARIQAGQIYLNAFGAGGGVEYPFGGYKKSGYGREKGFEALDAYTQTKTVIAKLY